MFRRTRARASVSQLRLTASAAVQLIIKRLAGVEYSQLLYSMVADIKVSGYSTVGDPGISHPHTLFGGGAEKMHVNAKSPLESTVEKLPIYWIGSICCFFCAHEWYYFIRYSRFI